MSDNPARSIFDAKKDYRERRGAWAPGKYMGICVYCRDHFIGDKRAACCADCAYDRPAPEEQFTVAAGTRMLTPYENEILTILVEECAEVIQRATKMMRFGVDEVQPGQSEPNDVRLSGEVGDLVGMIDEAAKEGLILPVVIEHFAGLKPKALVKYMQNHKAK